tara:strand:- start:989 stop:1642 length:654 start_codon:yes stop_codon:yes gene_type:complete
MFDINKVYTSNNCGDFTIVSYIKASEVNIKFIKTGYETTVSAGNIIKGRVRDLFFPSTHGVGFAGGLIKGGTRCKAYFTWASMLRRCYSDKGKANDPSYRGVTVCSQWHNYQNFAKWFDENYIKGFHIDKDLKQACVDNKVYSPKTCQFISQADNSIEANSKNYEFINPNGESVSVYNLTEFCRGTDLCQGHMSQLHLGKLKAHKGWTVSKQVKESN